MVPFLLFIHIPKTAGTTLIQILKGVYGNRYLYGGFERESDYLPNENTYAEISQTLADKLAFGAHMPYGVHKALQRPYEYMSFLREPKARAVSHYNFHIRTHPSFANKTIIQFYEETTFTRKEMQTRYLTGREAMLKPEITVNDFEQAKHNLTKIKLFGIVERFDESVVYIQEHLAWKARPYYLKSNQSKRIMQVQTLTFAKLSSEEKQYIEHINQYYLQLYKLACELFESRLSELNSNF